MLENLAWRGTEGSATLARWRPDQEMQVAAREVTRRNPWGGVAGCIYFGGDGDGGGASASPRYFLAGARSLQRRVCATTALSGSPAAPASGADARRAARARRRARPRRPRRRSALDRAAVAADAAAAARVAAPADRRALPRLHRRRCRVDALGRRSRRVAAPTASPSTARALDVGFSIDLTIDPALQALAQKTAACYTGRHDVCRALGMHRNEDGDQALGEQLLEGAMVRMAAVAVIDVASGRIEALAGALSPCARQEVDGPGRDARCDARLPYPSHYRADALLNPAVFHDAMPASTIKPIMAAAFLADPRSGARWLARRARGDAAHGVPARDSLRGQLMRSDSARFLDRMFCSDEGFAACAGRGRCRRRRSAFGWNAGCAEGREACGKRDLLFGRPLDARAGNALAPARDRGRLRPAAERAARPAASARRCT